MFVKKYLILVVLSLCFLSGKDLFAAGRIYGGFSTIPLELKGLKNMDITDYYNDQGGLEYTSTEGRIFLELEEKEETGIKAGLGIGAEYLIGDFGIAVEFAGYAGTSGTIYSGLVGLEYRLINNDFFYLGVMPRIGFTTVRLDLGTTQVASGYTPPVYIFNDGVQGEGVYDDEKIEAEISALTTQLVLTFGLRLGEELELFGYAGATKSYFGDLVIKVAGEEVDKDSHQLVNHLGYTQALPEPEIESNGAFVMVGVAYNFK